MRSHKKLDVYKEAMRLVKAVYEATGSFPQSELYGLTNQIRRSAVSVPSNIAEGAARSGDREFLKFLFIARGSLSELETQLTIAKELGFLGADGDLFTRVERVFGLLGGLIRSVQGRAMGGQKL